MFGQLPDGYVDPVVLARRYPTTTKPTLPSTFVAPDVRRENYPVATAAGGGLVVIGILGAIGLALAARSSSASRGDRRRR